MTLGKRIKEIRTILGYTQDQLAKCVGISRISIGNYERNSRVPDGKTLNNIAHELGTTSDYLLNGVSSSPKIDEWTINDVWRDYSSIKEHEDLELQEYIASKGYEILPSVFNYNTKELDENKHILLLEEWKNPDNQYYIFSKRNDKFFVPPEAVIELQNNVLRAIEFEWFRVKDKYKNYIPPTKQITDNKKAP